MATSVVGHLHVGRIRGASSEGNVAVSKVQGRGAVKVSRCARWVSSIQRSNTVIFLAVEVLYHLSEVDSIVRVVGARAASQNANGTSVSENFGGKLRLFIDTADAGSWQRWLPSGAFYGVTTNPILLEKANVACQVETLSDLANRAFNLGAEEVQIQTWGQTVEEMVSTGSKLAEISPGSIVVKIPVTENGLQAASQLTKSGIRVTMTGVYSVHQALLAVGVGAAYAAPYLGRMVALGKPGMKDIEKMQEIVTGVGSDMRLLVASIKEVKQITKLAASGVNSFAIPVPIIEELFQDDDTEKAAAAFEEAVARTLTVNAAASR